MITGTVEELNSIYINFVSLKSNAHMVNKEKIRQRRAIIFPKDIENFTGLTNRTACRMLENIRKTLGKRQGALITIKEFCAFYTIEESLIREYLMD